MFDYYLSNSEPKRKQETTKRELNTQLVDVQKDK